MLALTGVVMLIAPVAEAATVIEFRPATASPGTEVKGQTLGAGMTGVPSDRVSVFLAPSQRIADAARGPRDRRLTRFGIMTADPADVGHFRGRVPSLGPGQYVAVAFCRSCVPGGSLFTVGRFDVGGPTLPRTGDSISVIFGLAICALFAGTISAYALTRHRRASARR